MKKSAYQALASGNLCRTTFNSEMILYRICNDTEKKYESKNFGFNFLVECNEINIRLVISSSVFSYLTFCATDY